MQINFLRNKIIDYPSGSALEYRNGISYLIGDDVNHILMLDDDWNVIGRLQLFEYDGLRIPKPEKPDLECATIIGDMLYVVGSGCGFLGESCGRKDKENKYDGFLLHLQRQKSDCSNEYRRIYGL
jgi:hypothetical protein